MFVEEKKCGYSDDFAQIFDESTHLFNYSFTIYFTMCANVWLEKLMEYNSRETRDLKYIKVGVQRICEAQEYLNLRCSLRPLVAHSRALLEFLVQHFSSEK